MQLSIKYNKEEKYKEEIKECINQYFIKDIANIIFEYTYVYVYLANDTNMICIRPDNFIKYLRKDIKPIKKIYMN